MPVPPVDEAKRAGLRAKRASLVFFFAVSLVFVAMTSWQLLRPVFGLGPNEDRFAPPAACARALGELERALDRAMSQSIVPPAGMLDEEDDVLAAFERAALPEWGNLKEVERLCAGARRGGDAFASLARLKRAEERFVRRQVTEIAPLRRDLEAYGGK